MDMTTYFNQCLGSAHVLTGDDMAPYLVDWEKHFHGQAAVVVRPQTTAEVASIMAYCHEQRIPVVPQGGNTGLVGGGIPDQSARAVVLSLKRMNRIRTVDGDNDTMEVEAGCILQDVQQAAREANRLFPLSLAAEGSCTIGGNLATNAGGTQVLCYGNMRELALGLEVVTPTGDIWHGLRGLRKDNTGYSLRDLFIGSEGTLGVITAAVLKLFPLPKAQVTAILAVPSVAAAVTMLRAARRDFAGLLTGFELLQDVCINSVAEHTDGRFAFVHELDAAPWYVLLEISDNDTEAHAAALFEQCMMRALDAGIISDAVISRSIEQRNAMWQLRETVPMVEETLGPVIELDISLPTSKMADFVAQASQQLAAHYPQLRTFTFGHLGDGNLHYDILPVNAEAAAHVRSWQEGVHILLDDLVYAMGGSISAEHGIGQLKYDLLPNYADPTGLAIMRQIKQALDPAGIMNPGKLIHPR